VYASSLDVLDRSVNSFCRLAGHPPQAPGTLRIIASVSERDSRREFVAEDLGVLRGIRVHWCGSMRVCARSGRLRVGVADERVGRNQLAACLLQVLVLRYRVHLVDNSDERAVGDEEGMTSMTHIDADASMDLTGHLRLQETQPSTRSWDACRVSSSAGLSLCLNCSPVVHSTRSSRVLSVKWRTVRVFPNFLRIALLPCSLFLSLASDR